MQFYEMKMADQDRWHLAILDHFPDGRPVDIWAYGRCTILEEPKPVPFRIQVEGKLVDYNPTAFSAIVVSCRMAELIERIAPKDIQRISAVINGDKTGWNVINILPCVDCIDHKASLIQYYPSNDLTKAGKPRGVIRLVLDASRIGNHHIFHPKDWIVATVVSGALKVALEEVVATGIEFFPVTRI